MRRTASPRPDHIGAAGRRGREPLYPNERGASRPTGARKNPQSDKTTKRRRQETVAGAWDKAAAIVQNLRELRDTLQNKESEAVYNYQMNDGVWKNGQALQDVDQPHCGPAAAFGLGPSAGPAVARSSVAR